MILSNRVLKTVLIVLCLFAFCASGVSFAQEPSNGSQPTEFIEEGKEVASKVKDKVVETAEVVTEKAKEIGETIDESPAAHDVSNSILNPIYEAAETMGQYPAFYWGAFTLMVAGAVSFLLQVTLTKFFLLFKAHLNIKEILMDVSGLLVSLTGLVVTTQAAAENSESFVNSPAAVLSAVGLGAVVGLMFYIWGQRQEFQAAKGYAADRSSDS